MQSYRLGSRGDDGFELGPRLMEKGFRFAVWDEPGVQVTRAAWIDFFKSVQRRVELLELHCRLRAERGETVYHGPAGVFGKDNAKARDRFPAARMARARQPK